jgi:hypothetical protein
MSMIAEKQIVGRWNPDANNAAHQRAERIFSAGIMRAWVPMLHAVILPVVGIFEPADQGKVLFRVITDQQWEVIEKRIDKLFSHKVWDDPSPDSTYQLKVNAVDQIRRYLSSRGLTASWILGINTA